MGSAFGRRAQSRRRQPANLEPLIERLDRIEARVIQAEWRPAPELSGKLSADVAAVRASLASIDERLAAHSRELELLCIRAAVDEKLSEAEIRLIERRLKDVAATLPADVEAIVVPRVEGLRRHLRAEMNESVASALQALEQSVDSRVSSRINSRTDANLRKLANAVERSGDLRAPEPLPAPEPIFFFELPFERRLLKQTLADSAPSVPPAVATFSETDTLRWRIVREDQPSRRPNVTLALI